MVQVKEAEDIELGRRKVYSVLSLGYRVCRRVNYGMSIRQHREGIINMAVPNPYQYQYQQYQQQQVFTAPPEKLLLMLYDGAIRFCNQAKKAIGDNNNEEANSCLIKVQNIIRELMGTLDEDYEISKSLNPLYDYFYGRIVEANIHKDCASIDEVLGFLVELRQTWAEAIVLIKGMKRP